jgi:hypothetical protein
MIPDLFSEKAILSFIAESRSESRNVNDSAIPSRNECPNKLLTKATGIYREILRGIDRIKRHALLYRNARLNINLNKQGEYNGYFR